jgi:putative ABC transport system permease protein
MRDWTAFVRSNLALPDLTSDRETRIVRELAAQLEDFYREAVARGASDEQADAFARQQIDDWTRMARELSRADHPHVRPRIERLTHSLEHMAASGGRRSGALKILGNILTDMRYGIRQLVKAPGFTIVAVLTLAFGIGATTAIFSVVNGVILRPLPYPNAESLVRVFEVVPRYGRFAVAPANFLDWRQQNGAFERIAAYNGSTDTFMAPDGPERINQALVSWDTFDLLGVTPALGRSFRGDEDAPKRNDVIVISHGMWQRRFGSDPAVLGRTIQISGTPVTVVGVMPAGFYFPSRAAEFWRPIALNPANATRGGHFLGVIARLKPGTSLEQASSEMKGLAERLALQYPNNSRDESAEVVRMHDLITGPIRPMLLTLLAAVGVVVLIACANVANLMLVRASVREKELAIRAALGAGRMRLVLQMIGESLVLALAGGTAGILLAYFAIAPIQTLGTGSIPRVADITIDRGVLGFALAVTLATGFLFGLAPAWQASRGGVGAVLKEGGRTSAGARGHRIRGALLVAEVALSLVLLVGAALLLRSFARLTHVDPGFAAEQVLSFAVALPQTAYPEEPQRIAFFDRLLDKLRSMPGVRAAGMVQQMPIRGDYVLSFTIQGRPQPEGGIDPSANYRVVSPGYFESLSIPLVRGRMFTPRDTSTAPKVAVIDEAFAARHFAGEDPIGRGLDIGNGTDGFFEIVGVVGSVHYEGLDAAPRPTMYVPFAHDVFSTMTVMVRTSGEPSQFTASARQALHEIDANLPAFSVATLSKVVSESVAQRRFSMLLLGAFALLALFLAAVGLYGVVAYAVSQRTQEIGLRMAIGAQRSDVLRLVLGGGMKLAALGVVIGIAGALALSEYLAAMLFQVTRFDATSYALTAAVLLAVSAIACYVPARRAMGVDPLVALRSE